MRSIFKLPLSSLHVSCFIVQDVHAELPFSSSTSAWPCCVLLLATRVHLSPSLRKTVQPPGTLQNQPCCRTATECHHWMLLQMHVAAAQVLTLYAIMQLRLPLFRRTRTSTRMQQCCSYSSGRIRRSSSGSRLQPSGHPSAFNCSYTAAEAQGPAKQH